MRLGDGYVILTNVLCASFRIHYALLHDGRHERPLVGTLAFDICSSARPKNGPLSGGIAESEKQPFYSGKKRDGLHN